eukprot:CAMPEP_0194169442 /NCGR_PEP_ID=MMETSP0154-20130528/4115_1 /TAXON_ID=1049557 /ORGANISM="Thalassiothrix antarctica, Strain L6-D1" /LENGTH=142 /DNA_ID=CAMNT_0038880831 /DNA_START=44 /DNA_END=472 /DNA_ORIENTATION=-
MFRLFLLACFLPTIVVGDGCSICGEGKEVTNNSAVFEFPGQPSVPCNLLQQAGKGGQIPLDQCSFLPTLNEISVCECAPIGGGAVDPTPAPVNPTPMPVLATLPPVSEAPASTQSTSDAFMDKQTAAVFITLLVGFFGLWKN